MSGGGINEDVKRECASRTCRTFAIINLICKILPAICAVWLFLMLFGGGTSRDVDYLYYLGFWGCVALPLLWGIYLSRFGLQVSKTRNAWDEGKSSFIRAFWLMLLGELAIHAFLYYYVTYGCLESGCFLFFYLFPFYWLDILLQLGTAIPIFFIWKQSKLLIE